MFRLGAGLSTLTLLFCAFDAITKILQVAPVMDACQKMGISPAMAFGIGIVLLACATLYAIPRTAILGALLLTAYLGGAVAVQVIGKGGIFPIVFPIGFCLLVWCGLILRDPAIARWILARRWPHCGPSLRQVPQP